MYSRAGYMHMERAEDQSSLSFCICRADEKIEIIIAHDRAEAHAELPVYRNIRA